MKQPRSTLATIGRFLIGLAGVGIIVFGVLVAYLIEGFAAWGGGRPDYTPAWLFIAVGLVVLASLVITRRPHPRPGIAYFRSRRAPRDPDTLIPCANCGRSIDTRRPACLYCGAGCS